MEKISECCKAVRKIIDNWKTDIDTYDNRFSYVCSQCGKDFIPQAEQNESPKS